MDKIIDLLLRANFVFLIFLQGIGAFFDSLLKIHVRWTNCRKEGHAWSGLGDGFFRISQTKIYSRCHRCGKIKSE